MTVQMRVVVAVWTRTPVMRAVGCWLAATKVSQLQEHLTEQMTQQQHALELQVCTVVLPLRVL